MSEQKKYDSKIIACWLVWLLLIGLFCTHPKPLIVIFIIVVAFANWFVLVNLLDKALAARGISTNQMKFNSSNPLNLSIFYIRNVYFRK
jgi:hypothetical protein